VVLLGSARDLVNAPWRLGEVELVFNLAEGSHGRCREAWVPALLELHGVPYVGSDPLALALGLDKVVCKRLAHGSGVPTPRWICLEHPRTLPAMIPLTFPLLVKPRWEGSGRGRTRRFNGRWIEPRVCHATWSVRRRPRGTLPSSWRRRWMRGRVTWR
jgi:D-alanine-D-alanine ligase